MRLLLLAPMFCLICILIYGLFQIRNLVVFEQAHYPDEWESDNFPEAFLLGGNFAMSACAFIWLFLTPDWVPHQEQTVRYLRSWRWCALIWILGFPLSAGLFAQMFP